MELDGTKITELRESRGWSRAELARRAGMNASTISLIERGRFTPYPSQAKKLAVALGIELDGEES